MRVSNYEENKKSFGGVGITICRICGKKLFGRVEIIDNIKYYGFVCIDCKKWEVKWTKPLPDITTFIDNRIYKIKLTGGANNHQLKRIAELTNISLDKARMYLPIEEEIILEEGKADIIRPLAECMLIDDLYFEIEPEFPFKISGILSEEEKKEITKKIHSKLEQKNINEL